MSEQSRIYFSDFYISNKLYPSHLYRSVVEVLGYPFTGNVPSPNVVDEKHLSRLRAVDLGWVNKAMFMLHEKDNLPIGWEIEALLLYERPVIIVNEDHSVRLQYKYIEGFLDYANIGRHRQQFEKAVFEKVGRGIASTVL